MDTWEKHKSDHDDAFGEIVQQRDGQNNGKARRQRPRALSICGWIYVYLLLQILDWSQASPKNITRVTWKDF